MIIEDVTDLYLDRIIKWRRYLEKYLFSDRLQDFIAKHIGGIDVNAPPSVPVIVVSNTCGASIGGQTWYYKDTDEGWIELSEWIIDDEEQVRSILRHELAHYIKEYCRIEALPHSKEYTKVLKIVSPKHFRKDRHWKPTKEIDMKRRLIHPRIKIRT